MVILSYVVAALREHKEFKTYKYMTFQLLENKFEYAAYVFTHEFTCKNFGLYETRLCWNVTKNVTKLTFQSYFFVEVTIEIQNLYRKNASGCLSVNWLTFHQEKRKLHVFFSPSPPPEEST